jgi:hypothetical protein
MTKQVWRAHLGAKPPKPTKGDLVISIESPAPGDTGVSLTPTVSGEINAQVVPQVNLAPFGGMQTGQIGTQ